MLQIYQSRKSAERSLVAHGFRRAATEHDWFRGDDLVTLREQAVLGGTLWLIVAC